jgi:hypothetical protein
MVQEHRVPATIGLHRRFVAVDQGAGGFEYVRLRIRFVAKAPVKRVR